MSNTLLKNGFPKLLKFPNAYPKYHELDAKNIPIINAFLLFYGGISDQFEYFYLFLLLVFIKFDYSISNGYIYIKIGFF